LRPSLRGGEGRDRIYEEVTLKPDIPDVPEFEQRFMMKKKEGKDKGNYMAVAALAVAVIGGAVWMR
jgi:hypothetical protein